MNLKLLKICESFEDPSRKMLCLQNPKLNFGSGHMFLKDHINFDIMSNSDEKLRADIVCNIDQLNDIGLRNAFEGVLFSHVIEHIYPSNIKKILNIIHNLMVDGGTLIVEAPDIFKIITNSSKSLLNASNDEFNKILKQTISEIYGDEFNFGPEWSHHWGYTGNTTAEILRQSNFKIISIGDGITHNHPERDFRVTARKV
jgi:hypothetical protein